MICLNTLLGYKKDHDNPKLCVVGKEDAPVVEKIYNLRKRSENTVKIAKLHSVKI